MKLLLKIRLSHYFFVLFSIYLALAFFLPHVKFESAALTLFSVNSFLYGFYIAPILGAQKARIEELHKIVRSEANSLFSMALVTKSMQDKLHDEVLAKIKTYIQAVTKGKKVGAGEPEYEDLISFSVNYKGSDKDQVKKLLDLLITNQANRSNLSLQMSNKVYSNEWWIMLVLFSITLSFVLLFDVSSSIFLKLVKALLCTGLSMLLIILVKLSTLSHKKAKTMWQPLVKLLETHFYRID